MRKDEILQFVASWMELEAMLSEVSHKEKDNYQTISLIYRE